MAPRARVYIETTTVSYLMARPSRDVRVAAHQQVTFEWWYGRRREFLRDRWANETRVLGMRRCALQQRPTWAVGHPGSP